jgi:hypothetical protein
MEEMVVVGDDVDVWWIVDFSETSKIPEKKSDNKSMRWAADWEPLSVKFDTDDVLVIVRLKDFDFIADCFVVDEALLDPALTVLLFVWESKSNNHTVCNIN